MSIPVIRPTLADQALRVEQSHIWLHCFRTCARCESLSDTLTAYDFNDGSRLILDSSHPFPQPVKSKAALRIA
ncbi:hypothetical protein [Alteromonas sp. RKMC-009]|uniref:hypothetical protein n=1 Tax=Alteromonas sp. RKMC-009 TaxID=2267264 RepID=UPI000C5FD23B|nr:hypothetical protein [Alteromonas sp. RKMC-009]AYA65235.1 hypothetical protein DS731_15095 [Alteromonas sp. RKMC-009]MBT81987.1 hypothetical protein [Alteromonadaceae bacterium]